MVLNFQCTGSLGPSWTKDPVGEHPLRRADEVKNQTKPNQTLPKETTDDANQVFLIARKYSCQLMKNVGKILQCKSDQ